jgi:hypothetical protein
MAIALAGAGVETGSARSAVTGHCGSVAASFAATAGMVVPLVDGPYEEYEEEVEIMEARARTEPGQAAA